ncbi:MAG TPA: hypothetical protein DCG52_00620 [Alphaproteobacteria bacterium]|nr:hypothetical protein [Alphaproteobacteria bacterium]
MLICYHRSSSLGTLDFCEQKYFLEYNLSFKDKTNPKALMGTVVHKALQVLGDKKLCINRGNKSFTDDELGRLTLKECDDLEKITTKAFKYYTKHQPEVKLGKSELTKCVKWVNKAVEYNDGLLDPRNQDVFATEQYFDIEIKKPWAKYCYDIGGEKIEGYLSIKGTVDLIVRHDEKYHEILDYKTGKRINWATGEEKTLETLQSDTQLLLYYYALKNLYPEYDFGVSIFYINAGGLFSMCFEDKDYVKAENILKQKFQYIRNVKRPNLLSNENKHWKCQKLCKFSEQHKDTGKSLCQFIRDEVKLKGVNKVVSEYGDLNKLSSYGSGGGKLKK